MEGAEKKKKRREENARDGLEFEAVLHADTHNNMMRFSYLS